MQNALTFLMKKKSFAPMTNNFWSFKIRIKSYLSKRQNFFFSSEIWGHFAFTFCRYFPSKYEGIYLLQVLSIRIWGYLPSAGKYHQILRAIPVDFWDEVFSLRIWGHFIQQCGLKLQYKSGWLFYHFPHSQLRGGPRLATISLGCTVATQNYCLDQIGSKSSSLKQM